MKFFSPWWTYVAFLVRTVYSSDICTENVYHDLKTVRELTLASMPANILLYLSPFTDNPYNILSSLCTSMRVEMNSFSPEMMLQSRAKYLAGFDKIQRSTEFYRLLKLNPILYNEFFNDFLDSDYCYRVMNKTILEYKLQRLIVTKSSNPAEFDKAVQSLFKKLQDGRKYDCIERLLDFLYVQNNFNTKIKWSPNDASGLVKHLYSVNRMELVNEMLKRLSNDSDIIAAILQIRTVSAEEFWGLLEDVDFEGDSNKFRLITRAVESAIKKDSSVITDDEKDFLLARYAKFLSDPLFENNSIDSDKTLISRLRIIATVRYSKFIDVEEISRQVANIYKEETCLVDSAEHIAIQALVIGNKELFFAMLEIRKKKKYSVKIYPVISSSPQYMNLFTDEELMKISQSISSQITNASEFQMHILGRKSAHLLQLSDLRAIIKVPDYYAALAKFVSPEKFYERLKRHSGFSMDLLKRIMESLLKYLVNPVEALYLIAKIASNLPDDDYPLYSDIWKVFRDNDDLINMFLEPRNAHILSDLSVFPDHLFSSNLKTEELVFNPDFRLALTAPVASQLRARLQIDWNFALFRTLALPHEIVQLFRAFGHEIGNFDVETQDDLNELLLKKRKDCSIDDFVSSNRTLDLTLLSHAIKYFQEFEEINFSTAELQGTPMRLKSFSIFFLWWERNPRTFARFAPPAIVEAFAMKVNVLNSNI